jgi:hypothetical protein
VQKGVGRAPSKPSLLISPDLDALLEHDERTRRLTNDFKSSDPLLLTASPGTDIFTGLSPPPRGPRRTSLRRSNRERSKSSSSRPDGSVRASRQAESDLEGDIIPNSTSTSNPFINPAPTVEVILSSSILPPLLSSSTTKSIFPGDYVDSRDSKPFTMVEEEAQPGISNSLLSPSGEPKISRTPHSRPADLPHERAHPSLSLPRIQVKAKNLLGIFSDGTQDSEYHVTDQEHSESHRKNRKNRKRGKLVKPKDTCTLSHPCGDLMLIQVKQQLHHRLLIRNKSQGQAEITYHYFPTLFILRDHRPARCPLIQIQLMDRLLSWQTSPS